MSILEPFVSYPYQIKGLNKDDGGIGLTVSEIMNKKRDVSGCTSKGAVHK